MARHEGAELELVLQSMERWLDELVEVKEQLRAIEGVMAVNQVRAVLEERRSAIQQQLQGISRELYLRDLRPDPLNVDDRRVATA